MSQAKTKVFLIVGLLLALGVFLAISNAVTAAPAPVEPAQAQATPEIPFFTEWAASGHNDAESPAFTHWDEENPQEIPTSCAKCHSTPGFQDYAGADGSAVGTVDKAHPIGTTITCTACHNSGTMALTSVAFPSGAVVSNLGREAVCMSCHQGVASKVQVDDQITKVAPATDDTVMPNSQATPGLTFTNIHYYAAAVSRYGKEVMGGYQYEGKAYDALFDHVPGVDQCQDCHDPHSLELQVEKCTACHAGATSVEGVRAIRMESSLVDYDGDGNLTEGIADEIAGLQAMLLTAMQTYATKVAEAPLAYDAAAYPYFFNDTNANGTADPDEAAFPNAYNSWTARLVKAAFNYQTSIKDPGSYAHGGKYIIELLYDSISDLNTKITPRVSLIRANRTDHGHFDGSSEAFRHWDEEEAAPMTVPASCAKCHSGEGLPQLLTDGAVTSQHASNGLLCQTCHTDSSTFAVREINEVTFPSGAKVTFGEANVSNLCLHCHQGRESAVSVNRAIGTTDPDTVSETLTFRNVHYFAAGATLFGTEAKGMAEYPDKTYVGRFTHAPGVDTCAACHDAHALEVKTDTCVGCHQTSSPSSIRMPTSPADYDGDGNAQEPISGEVDTMKKALLAAIQTYATETAGTAIAYSSSRYPYWFVDANGNALTDADEGDRYATFTPKLLRGAYNYQFVSKDPGAYVHNAKYVLQVMYDAIEDLGGDVSAMTRP